MPSTSSRSSTTPSTVVALLSSSHSDHRFVILAQDSNRLVGQMERSSQLAEILSPLLRCIQSYRLGRFADAYVALEKAAKYYFVFFFCLFVSKIPTLFWFMTVWRWGFFSAFLQEFRNWETPWAMEALYTLALEIRLLAEKVCPDMEVQGLVDFFTGYFLEFGPCSPFSFYSCRLIESWLRVGRILRSCRELARSWWESSGPWLYVSSLLLRYGSTIFSQHGVCLSTMVIILFLELSSWRYSGTSFHFLTFVGYLSIEKSVICMYD